MALDIRGRCPRLFNLSPSGTFKTRPQIDTLPAKMIAPVIGPWIVQRNLLACFPVNRHFSRRFAKRIGHTSQRQILRHRFAARRQRSYVIYMKSRFLANLRKTAILTTVFGPVDNEASYLYRNVFACHG
jgi:hypothetical protein